MSPQLALAEEEVCVVPLRVAPAPVPAARPAARPGSPAPNPARTLTDEQLAKRIPLDGGAPLAALYERHQQALYRYCLGVVRNPEEAADAAQDTWLRAFAQLQDGRARVLSVRPWLYAIARNACIDRIRTRKRTEPLDALADELVAGDQGVDVTFEQRAELRALLGDMGGLSEAQRSAIVLREVVGLDYAEIARVLESTEDRVSWLVSDARSSLHELRDARNLNCDAVRPRFLSRSRDRVARAHLATCADCQAFERKRIGARLSSRCFVPFFGLWHFLRETATRTGLLAAGGDGPATALKSVAACAAAVVVAGGAVSTTTGTHRGHRDVVAAGAGHVASASAVPRAASPIVVASTSRVVRVARPAAPVSRIASRVAGGHGGTSTAITAHVPAAPQTAAAPAPSATAVAPAPPASRPEPVSAPPVVQTVQATVDQTVRRTVDQARERLQQVVQGLKRTVQAAAAPVQQVVNEALAPATAASQSPTVTHLAETVRHTVDGILAPRAR